MEKILSFRDEFITCTTCDCNYIQNGSPEFCQEFKTTVDPKKANENMQTAKNCKYWWPKGVDRKFRDM